MKEKRCFILATCFLFLLLGMILQGTSVKAAEEKVINVYYRGIGELGAKIDIQTPKTTANGKNLTVSKGSTTYFKVDMQITHNGYEYKYLGYMWNTYNPSRPSNGSETIYSGVRGIRYDEIPEGEYGEIIFIYMTKVVNVHYRERTGPNQFTKIAGVSDEREKYRAVKVNGNSGTIYSKKVDGYHCIGYIVHYYSGPGIESCMYSSNDIKEGTSTTVYYSASEMRGNSNWLWSEVIFVYEKAPAPISVTVEYRDYDTGQIIEGTKVTSYTVSSSQTFIANLPSSVKEYEFYGSQKGNNAIEVNKNSVKVNVTDGNLTIIFYYIKPTSTPPLTSKEITIYYRTYENQKIYSFSSIPEERQIIQGTQTISINTTKDKQMKAKGYTYDGYVRYHAYTNNYTGIEGSSTNVSVNAAQHDAVTFIYTESTPTSTSTPKPTSTPTKKEITIYYRVYEDQKIYSFPSITDDKQTIIGTQTISVNPAKERQMNAKGYTYYGYVKKHVYTSTYTGIEGSSNNVSVNASQHDAVTFIYTEATPTPTVTPIPIQEPEPTPEPEKESTVYCKIIGTNTVVPGTPWSGTTVTRADSPLLSSSTIGEYLYTGYVSVDGNERYSNRVELVDNESHEIIFWYKEPDPRLIFGEKDPNDEKVNNYDTLKEKIKDKAEATENQIFYPKNQNQQLIAKVKNVNNWVLDEKGTLVIRFATTKRGTNPKFNVSVSFPFQVKYGGKLTKTIEIDHIATSSYSIMNESKYIGYQAEITGIEIPISTPDELYRNTIIGKVTFSCDELGSRKVTGTEKCSVNVVGAVYDFSVTNLDGSWITGDTIWKTSLFATQKEYKAEQLPIGQGIANQQNTQYLYGIKQGTRIYFSVNTKGKKNTAIEIVPKFYYYNSKGELVGEVTLRDEKGNVINAVRKTSSVDENRMTTEYQSELLKGIGLYGANVYQNKIKEIGNYRSISIGTGLRMPFVNYGKDKEKYDEVTMVNDGNLLNVSHWYADFAVPNYATYYHQNQKLSDDGFVVVAFSIQTYDTNQKPYLAYHLASPFVQNTQQSEWRYERGNDFNFILPNKIEIVNGWQTGIDLSTIGEEGYVPVIIYQVNQSTKQNVDSSGTH